MRHGKRFNHLGRQKGHRKAMLTNMAISLIEHKRIYTTLAKAKAVRKFLEPLVTKAKNPTVHNRRVVFGYLQNKEAIKELFGPISVKIGERPGGYLRIIKTGFRQGDNADTAMVEFVDYNETLLQAASEDTGKKRTRRGRRRKKDNEQGTAENVENAVEETVEDVQEEDNNEATA